MYLKLLLSSKLGAGGGLMKEASSSPVGNRRFTEAQRQLGCYDGQLQFNLKKPSERNQTTLALRSKVD